MTDGIQPTAGTGGFPRPVADLADNLRMPWIGVPACAALQFATAFFVYSRISGEPTGELLQIWGAAVALLISFSFTWRGLVPTPDRLFLGNLLVQCAAFEIAVISTGHSPVAGAWVFLANLVQAGVAAFLYRWFIGRDDWAPRSASDLVTLLLASVVASVVTTPLGAWPGLGIDQAWSEVAFWWMVRGSADMAIGAIPSLLVCHSRAGGHLRVPWPWFNVLLLPAAYVANRVMFQWPTLPLAWLVILCALWGGLVLTPRLAGMYALTCSLITVFVGVSLGRPWNSDTVIGQGVVVDLLSLICIFLVTLLPLVRAQRARMQARVAAQGALLNTVFEAMGDGVVVFEKDGSVAFANDRAAKLLGRELPARRPPSWLDYFGLTEVDGSPLVDESETVRKVIATGDALERDVAVPTTSGGPRFLRLSVRQFGNGDTRLVVVISDITERRLRQRELTKFAGRVAHDLRSPMTSAQLWLETVQQALTEGESSMATKSALRADQALQRLNQVVDSWLVYSISREGALELTTCRIDQLARDLIDALAPTDSGLDPEFTIDASHPVCGDETLVRELIANLIENAIKYGVPGAVPRVEVSTRRQEDMVEVTVRDHGQGIAAGDEALIFEEFHRGADVPDDVRGTGMGLATCKMIVERHGGTIRAERASGGGSRFIFALPAGQSTAG